MALPQHELDPVFEDMENIDQKLSIAVEKAKQAFAEQKTSHEESPGMVGPSPAQAARVAFIESLKG